MGDAPSPLDGYVAALVVRRVIRATPDRLFDAWTTPTQLMQWWGPKGVTCTHAEVDLRPGGHYRIANRLPDSSELWISGTFEVVERPTRLIYSWHVEAIRPNVERVSVTFSKVAGGTEVVVTHERIRDEKTRESHAYGWDGCLDGLCRYVVPRGLHENE